MNYSLFVANMTPHIPLPLSIVSLLRSLPPPFTPLYGNLQTAGEKKLTFAKPRGAEDGRSRYLQAAIQMTKFTFTRIAYSLQRNSST